MTSLTSYKQLYRQGLNHLDPECNELLGVLRKGESICLCSAYKMGDRRLVDYLVYRATKENCWNITYDLDNTFNSHNLRTFSQEIRPRTLLFIPYYSEKGSSFQKAFRKLTYVFKENLRTVIIEDPQLLDNPQSYFPDSIVPISYIHSRKPLSLKMTRLVIESRRRLNGWSIPKEREKDIWELTGGHVGLIKRLCSYYDAHEDLSIQNLLREPSIAIVLSCLATQYKYLSVSSAIRVGLRSHKGVCRIPLLSFLLNEDRVNSLSMRYQKLLDLFLKNPRTALSLETIHDHLFNATEEFSLWATYQLISRFRKAVSDTYILQSIRSKGYILERREK